MKIFLKELPKEIAITFTFAMIFITLKSLISGVVVLSIYTIIALFIFAILAGILELIAFTDIFLKKVSNTKRIIIFIIPLFIIITIFAVLFNWYDNINQWLKLFLGLFGGFIATIICFEIINKIKGEEYTTKLMEYKNKSK